VDLFRARASAALIALAFASGAAADCTALNGVFSDEPVERPEGAPRLGDLSPYSIRSRLVHTEPAPGPQGGFTGTAPRARPKQTRLASTVHLALAGSILKMTILDAHGKVLADTTINASPKAWKCAGNRFERSYESIGGLGESVRTERTQQALFAEKDGDLHFVETATIVETKSERRVEARFKRLPKAPAGK
jgi:hypothetical protein